ncbi:MAG: PEP/pyruvate-binding domain-containing protein, partial [Desulfatirhabdiaceae bacterium]
MLDWIRAIIHKKTHRKQNREQMLVTFRKKYVHFKILLDSNSQLLNIISDMEEKLRGGTPFGLTYVRSLSVRVLFYAGRMIQSFEGMTGKSLPELHAILDDIYNRFKNEDEPSTVPATRELILPYSRIDKSLELSVGGKNANLGEIRNHVHLPVPAGFAITTQAFRQFIDSKDLADKIKKIKEKLDIITPESILHVSQSIEAMLMAADMPSDIEADITRALHDMALETGQSERDMKVALRSSAVGEDSEYSFAGQYLSVMNVPYGNVIWEYKRVLASLFSERAITYRQHMGIPFEEAAMSVACIEMVTSTVSGVMYSRHPFSRLKNEVIIHAIWGLGSYVVDGVISPDIYILSRDTPPVLIEKSISNKSLCLTPDNNGYLSEQPVKESLRLAPCLSEAQTVQLAEYGLKLETHFGQAQDIEWAIDPQGRIIILQSRPLHQNMLGSDGPCQLKEIIPGYDLLIESGSIACPGVGCGPAHLVRSEADLIDFPNGGVLVAQRSYPQYVLVMQKAQAIVTDSGSLTGHMASLSREFKVPALLNTRIATSRIQPGEEITVDALSGRVYRGRVHELLNETCDSDEFIRNTPVYTILRRRADWIIQLNLVDPKSADFRAKNCRTIHDIMRFLHERSYGEIFSISDRATDHLNATARLNAPLLLDLYIIDLGGGIHEQAVENRTVTVDQIQSPPFLALLRGMLRKEFRNNE